MKKIAAGIAIAALIPTLLTGCIRKVEETPKETTAQPASSADTEAGKEPVPLRRKGIER